MIYPRMKPETNTEWIEKLDAGQKLWYAAHDDGSGNRINEDAVIEATVQDVSLGILTAAFLWIRKLFRNRGKTKEDLAAEKEAARINRTCGALEVMLPDYIRSAQEGGIGEEALDELIGTLDEMDGYDRAGKLTVPDMEELTGIRKSIEAYTKAIAKSRPEASMQEAEATNAGEFGRIKALLVRQKECLFVKNDAI